MDMEMEVQDEMVAASGLMERLQAAAAALEAAAGRLATVELEASLERVSAREAELEGRLAEAETTIAALKAEAGRMEAGRAGVRRTVSAGASASLLAKEGSAVDAGGVDAALSSLSVEQRIAVKAGLLRSGLLG